MHSWRVIAALGAAVVVVLVAPGAAQTPPSTPPPPQVAPEPTPAQMPPIPAPAPNSQAWRGPSWSNAVRSYCIGVSDTQLSRMAITSESGWSSVSTSSPASQ